MSAIRRYVQPEQSLAFNRAIAERLGLDPSVIAQDGFRADVEIVSGDEFGTVTVSFKARLPTEELGGMFNAAGTQARIQAENDE